MGPAVHVRLTRQWAIEEGFSGTDADAIAHANGRFDALYPARTSPANLTRHFAPTAWLWSRRYLGVAVYWGDLGMLGFALHCAQDAVAHGRLGQKHLLQLIGAGRDPDFWENLQPGVKRRTEAVTRARLRRYRQRQT